MPASGEIEEWSEEELRAVRKYLGHEEVQTAAHIKKAMKTRNWTIHPQKRIMPTDSSVGVLCGNQVISSHTHQ